MLSSNCATVRILALSATALLLLCLLTAAACLRQITERSPSQGAATRSVTDESGRRVTTRLKINRLVSLAPNLTEIVYAVGAGDRLFGDTIFCDYPPQARNVSKVGDTLHPSIETIIVLRPELVLVSTASQLEVFTEQLEAHEIPVYVTDPRDLEGVFRSIQHVGELLDQEQQALQLIEQLQQRTRFVERAVSASSPVKVFYQLSAEPLYTAGHDSFVTDLIRRAGGISVTAHIPGAWPKFSGESAIATRPEAIILPTGGAMGAANSSVADVLKRSPAVRNGRVYPINDDYLSRPGPRAVEGLEQMARALHPEAFKQ